jgi:hypothetical protein
MYYGISCTDFTPFVLTCITEIVVSTYGAYVYINERKPRFVVMHSNEFLLHCGENCLSVGCK